MAAPKEEKMTAAPKEEKVTAAPKELKLTAAELAAKNKIEVESAHVHGSYQCGLGQLISSLGMNGCLFILYNSHLQKPMVYVYR